MSAPTLATRRALRKLYGPLLEAAKALPKEELRAVVAALDNAKGPEAFHHPVVYRTRYAMADLLRAVYVQSAEFAAELALPPEKPAPPLKQELLWQEWNGQGEPPHDSLVVKVKLRDGSTPAPLPAKRFEWENTQDDSDIVAWALDPTAPCPGWHLWKGGPMPPVQGSTHVDMRFRDGGTEFGYAEDYRWTWDPEDPEADIIHWRLAKDE